MALYPLVQRTLCPMNVSVCSVFIGDLINQVLNEVLGCRTEVSG